MDTVKELFRTKSFWVFISVAILGGLGTFLPIPFLGVIIALLTIFGVSLQGVETVLTEHRIERARDEAATQHTEAMREIGQARREAATQHTEAMQEIDQARIEAATQHANAMQEIQKARDEAQAENILLEAKRFATSLMEKDARVNQAVVLHPDFRQREHRELGLEMSAAVIGNVDFIKQMYLRGCHPECCVAMGETSCHQAAGLPPFCYGLPARPAMTISASETSSARYCKPADWHSRLRHARHQARARR
jgi:hypothetical protein